MPSRFDLFARQVAHLAGTWQGFVVAVVVMLVWGGSGPLLGYSDTWQLILNTGGTIVTVLMLFLLQRTANRDFTAILLKLDELIVKDEKANNVVVFTDRLSDEELSKLRERLEANARKAGV